MSIKKLTALTALLTTILTFPAMAEEEKTAELLVNVDNVLTKMGKVRVMLFQDAEGFPNVTENASTILVDAKEGSVAVRYTGVPYGKYAVYVVHDEDDSGDLTTGFFGAKEGRAFSNKQKVNFIGSIPSFEDASFEIKEPKKEVSAELKY